MSRGATTLLPGQTPTGDHVLSVLLKRSYAIRADAACGRAAEDQPLLGGDVFWDTPMNSSVRLESDLVPYKLETDLVIIANAHAPAARPTHQFTAGVEVGWRRQLLLVTGKRHASFTGEQSTPVFTEPELFTEAALRFEGAYGGTDVFSDLGTVMPYPPNPRGRGFVVANRKPAVDGLALPNIEDPQNPLTPQRLCVGEYARWNEQPAPVTLGWVPKNWHPRCLLAGVMPADRATEQELRAAYAKLVPKEQRKAYVDNGLRDMDFAFFNGAPPGLRFPFGALNPGAPVGTRNLVPEGALDFCLPADSPRIGIDIGRGLQWPQTVLHTVQIRLVERELDMVWRTALPYPGRDWLPQMKRLHIEVAEQPSSEATASA
jgi:hypothetical protein